MDAIQGFDVAHQLFRIRNAKTMSEAEVSTIMRTLAENVKTYDQVVEVRRFISIKTKQKTRLTYKSYSFWRT
jgi:hypothetical protein